jgi:hypothetical protein
MCVCVCVCAYVSYDLRVTYDTFSPSLLHLMTYIPKMISVSFTIRADFLSVSVVYCSEQNKKFLAMDPFPSHKKKRIEIHKFSCIRHEWLISSSNWN